MRIVRKKIFEDLYYEQFGSYDEYWRIVEQRNRENPHCDSQSFEHICDDKSWVGCGSYEEAKSLLVKGWDANVEMLKECVKKEIDLIGDKRLTKTFSDVAGFMPIVPNAIMNIPNCMLNAKQERRKAKVIKFLFFMNRSYRYNSDDIIRKMSKILARISVLEKHGYRCRIEIFGSFHSGYSNGKMIVAHSVLIKSENQLFDIKRMAFPIAHSAMQRVFGFAWENSLPLDYNKYHCSGLGSSVQYWDKKNRDSLLDAINENNEKIIAVGMESDIDEVFGKVGD